MKKLILYLLVLSFTLAAFFGCKTDPDTSDTTPATIDWTIQNKTTGVETKLNGTATYSAKRGQVLTITGCANDQGGVKQLEYYTSSAHSCKSGNLANNVGPGLAVPTTMNLGLDADGKAWSRYCAIMNMTLTFNCSSNFTFASGWAKADIKATNYGNVVSNASLTINVTE